MEQEPADSVGPCLGPLMCLCVSVGGGGKSTKSTKIMANDFCRHLN